jgi:hypothetical protein
MFVKALQDSGVRVLFEVAQPCMYRTAWRTLVIWRTLLKMLFTGELSKRVNWRGERKRCGNERRGVEADQATTVAHTVCPSFLINSQLPRTHCTLYLVPKVMLSLISLAEVHRRQHWNSVQPPFRPPSSPSAPPILVAPRSVDTGLSVRRS